MATSQSTEQLIRGGAADSAIAIRRGVWITIATYVLTRCIVIGVALLAPQHRTGRPDATWWPGNPLIRWDSGHYLSIMTEGYLPARADGSIYDRTAFFPLYSLICWPVWQALAALNHLAGGGPIPPDATGSWTAQLALVIVSHVAGLAAVLVFWDWCRRTTGESAMATRAAIVLCTFPAAFYFSTGYSESVFVLFIALSLWCMQLDRPVLAALACAAATATRPTGIVLAAVLCLVNWLRLAPRPVARRFGTAAALGVLSVGGLIAHELYLWQFYGRPDAYFVAQAAWHTDKLPKDAALKAATFQPVLEPALKPLKSALRGEWGELLDGRNWNRLLNVLILAVACLGLARPGPIARPWLLLTVLVFVMAWLPDPYAGGRMLGITRYHLIGLPTVLWLASCRWTERHVPFSLLVGALVALQVIYTAGYVNWIMVS